MRVGEIYEIAMGMFKCTYIITSFYPTGYNLRRVNQVKSKEDELRFPYNITIRQK